MTFPSGSTINEWFQSAHSDALAAGGSVYNIKKHAEEQLVKTVLRWSYASLIQDLEQLGYRDRSRVVIHIQELANSLYSTNNEEFTDDYEDEDSNEYTEDNNDLDQVLMTKEALIDLLNETIKTLS